MTDALGSVRAQTDDGASVTNTADYDAWGNTVSGSVGLFGWDGAQTDAETGLTYLGARSYSPVFGQFLSPDPLGVTGTGTQGFSPYPFANDDPATLTDPSGLDPVSALLARLQAAGAGPFATLAAVIECVLFGECGHQRIHQLSGAIDLNQLDTLCTSACQEIHKWSIFDIGRSIRDWPLDPVSRMVLDVVQRAMDALHQESAFIQRQVVSAGDSILGALEQTLTTLTPHVIGFCINLSVGLIVQGGSVLTCIVVDDELSGGFYTSESRDLLSPSGGLGKAWYLRPWSASATIGGVLSTADSVYDLNGGCGSASVSGASDGLALAANVSTSTDRRGHADVTAYGGIGAGGGASAAFSPFCTSQFWEFDTLDNLLTGGN